MLKLIGRASSAGATVIVLGLVGCAAPRDPGAAAQTDTVTIHAVTVSGDTAPFTVDPDPVVVQRGDVVAWTHSGADSLEIDLSRAPLSPTIAVAVGGGTARAAIIPNAIDGDFKYAITARVGGVTTTYDPRIIVEE